MPHNLSYYLQCFQRLNRATIGNQKAPHKPILLLAIADLVADGTITDNHICLSDTLILRFKKIWKQVVDDGSSCSIKLADGLMVKSGNKYPFKCSIENPFYHMQREPFWRLIHSQNYVEKTNYSIASLRKCFLYANIDQELLELLQRNETRELITNELGRLI